MTLTEFLLARIAEDEAAYRAEAAGIEWLTVNGRNLWDKLLAECEAKRRIVDRHDVVDAAGGCAFCGEPAPCEHLRILATPYADHPDHREEWKP